MYSIVKTEGENCFNCSNRLEDKNDSKQNKVLGKRKISEISTGRKPLGEIFASKQNYSLEESIYNREVNQNTIKVLGLKGSTDFKEYEIDILELYVKSEHYNEDILKDLEMNGCKILFYAYCVLKEGEINLMAIKTLSNAALRLGVAIGITNTYVLRGAYEFAPQWLSLSWLLPGSEEKKLIQDFWCTVEPSKKLLAIEGHLKKALEKCEKKDEARFFEALLLVAISKADHVFGEYWIETLKTYETFLEQLQKRKSAEMCYLLGKLYLALKSHKFVSKELKISFIDRAMTLIKIAARGGHSAAMIRWAEYLYREEKEDSALYWIKCAKQKDSEAGYYYWGVHLLNNDEDDKENRKSESEAYDLLCLARKLGFPKAASGLAYHYIVQYNNNLGERGENLQKALSYWMIDLRENWYWGDFLVTFSDLEKFFELKDNWPIVFGGLAESFGYELQQQEKLDEKEEQIIKKKVCEMIVASGIVAYDELFKKILANLEEEDLAKRLYVLLHSYMRYKGKYYGLTDETLARGVQGLGKFILKLLEVNEKKE
ncbi:MAG: hypothetical protein COZ46_02260 [Verrucomicrobia bacterium CG_4_10_14_3_um_filter_43_23]|nr:MAG: hypothetical protein AUJ82_06700 [Verrucomicrobia bacterium CG1_02_43_26]PIP59765.1 MAG: hypothetical protein COX01_01770 [Verrucomicrobia bacterium CG22_combo_CG10-13_8_21_14_all_43_17]PIX58754.1 MAG: hypothetical protein COZ46_02260 [Verrucomicrobia bacterium CG_4_10_14_3_um_filter_43_23]PIY61107.1 MAG: hypothetical protein COY94_07055 [Verrucomicrobia bacterium CG_4_10_14_0_8_um_filter_43_34]PJA43525.1 MAG: hypothetical protein CO175_07775 [Verrucomicrobia bacterium CG_4_9_14_3_um_fi